MSSIDTASDLLKLRNQDRQSGEENTYYEDNYNVTLEKLEELFSEVSDGTDQYVDKNSLDVIRSVGLAWFLIAYELGRSHESIIRDIGDNE